MTSCWITNYVTSITLLSSGEGFKFTKSHEWALLEGNKVTVGITDYAQVSQYLRVSGNKGRACTQTSHRAYSPASVHNTSLVTRLIIPRLLSFAWGR